MPPQISPQLSTRFWQRLRRISLTAFRPDRAVAPTRAPIAIPPRIRAEQILGIDALMALDKENIGVFSRESLRRQCKYFNGLRQENLALHALLVGVLTLLPFRQRIRFVHRTLGIPGAVTGLAQIHIVRRRLGRMVRSKRIRIHG